MRAESRTWAISFGGARTIAARRQQVAFQAPGQMASVLDRPDQLIAVGQLLGPGQQREVIFRGGGDRLHASCRSLASTATMVWVRLCASTPRVTMHLSSSHGEDATDKPLRHGQPGVRTGILDDRVVLYLTGKVSPATVPV